MESEGRKNASLASHFSRRNCLNCYANYAAKVFTWHMRCVACGIDWTRGHPRALSLSARTAMQMQMRAKGATITVIKRDHCCGQWKQSTSMCHVPRTTNHVPCCTFHVPLTACHMHLCPVDGVGVCFVQCPHTHRQTHIQRANCNANKSNVLDKQRQHKRRNQTSEQTKRTPQASPMPASTYLPPFLPLHVAISQWQI